MAEVDQLIRRLSDTCEGGTQGQRPIGARQYLTAAEGDGHWDMIRVAHGLFLSVTDATYRKPTHMHLPAEPMFKIRIMLSGALLNDDGVPLAESGDVSLQTISGRACASYHVAATREPLRMLVLHVKPRSLLAFGFPRDALVNCIDAAASRPPVRDGVTAISGGQTFRRIAQEVFASFETFDPSIRMRYLAAKAEELLCFALQSAQPNRALTLGGNRIRTKDEARLRDARDILCERLNDPPSITELARLVGLNETKLKAGFKQAFGEPPYSYSARRRLEAALQLIETTDLSFAEIAYRVGYRFPANFSQAFRQRFGVSPRAARRAAQGGD